MKPDRVVVGTDNPRTAELLKTLYDPFTRNRDRMIVMDVRSAELTKYAANAMLATKISFMNEIANLAERMGADIEKVRVGIGSDPRIGYSFIYPGAGYGGSCFPKDVKALVHSAGEHDFDAQLLKSVEAVNKNQKQVLFEKISEFFGGKLKGKTIAVWGLAFKPNTDDMREAPARVLIEALWGAGAKVQAYDPVAMGEAGRIYGQRDDLELVEGCRSGTGGRRCAGDRHRVAGVPQPGFRRHARCSWPARPSSTAATCTTRTGAELRAQVPRHRTRVAAAAQSKATACARAVAAASFAETVGAVPRSGHAIDKFRIVPPQRSLHRRRVMSVVLYRTSALSVSTRKPCAKPGGIHSCRWFSALSSIADPLAEPRAAAPHVHRHVEDAPCVTRTSLPCACGGSW